MCEEYKTAGPVFFYGRSDDLVEVEGLYTTDGHAYEAEYNVNVPGHTAPCADRWIVNDYWEIRAYYNGCWSFSVGLVWHDAYDGGAPLRPDYVATLKADPDCNYSMRLRLDVPHSTIIRHTRDAQ